MIAPLVMGAGIKVKVLEALSAGVPLLTNEIGMSIAEKKFVKNNFDKMISYERYRDSLLHIAGKK